MRTTTATTTSWIIVPDNFPAGQANTHTAFQCVRGRRIPMDVAMVRLSRFRVRAAQLGTLGYQVSKDGILLYEGLYERADRL
jgi:hypothetical protein